MAHFAKLDSNNVVTEIHVVKNDVITDSDGNEQEQLGIDFLNNLYKKDNVVWKKTSYNTKNNKHYYENESGELIESDDQSKAYRKNYAAIGGTYDATRDAFIPPKPYESWILNEETCTWDAPIEYPNDGKRYEWNGSSNSWVEMKYI